MQLRDYQLQLEYDIHHCWEMGHNNVCAVSSTGSGKTRIVASIIHDHVGAAVVMAHRNELVTQMSVALGQQGVVHGIIAPEKTIKQICREHTRELGTVMFDPGAPTKVAGVNTLVRRQKELASWMHQVTMVVGDEGHHYLSGNIFGRAIDMFNNAKGLFVTATPIRADGKGLGRHADGLMDVMVEGPPMHELIERGYLSDYRIFGPPSDLDVSKVETAADGDYKKPQLKKAVQESHIVGDVVDHYLKIASGKLGVTFVSDVETAGDVAAQFNIKGVRAEVLSANTPGDVRAAIIGQFRNRQIMQLVNVDILGEGFDLGSGATVEVVSMARPTMSYGLFVQQFGRAIRPKADGSPGIIIDHVNNILRHGLPDKERVWSLDAREKSPRVKNPDDDIPMRFCSECTQPYEKVLVSCPYCGTKYIPAARGGPELVDGDLFELDPATLAQMRGEVARVDEDPLRLIDRMKYAGAPQIAIASAAKNHRARSTAQSMLREMIAWYSAHHHKLGRSDAEIQRRFYFTFKIDIMSAMALGRREAETLALKISLTTQEIFHRASVA